MEKDSKPTICTFAPNSIDKTGNTKRLATPSVEAMNNMHKNFVKFEPVVFELCERNRMGMGLRCVGNGNLDVEVGKKSLLTVTLTSKHLQKALIAFKFICDTDTDTDIY